MIKQNIGIIDRVLRMVIGIVLLFIGLSTKSGFLLLGSLFCFFEAFFSWCAFYQVIGKNTCPLPTKDRKDILFVRPLLVGLSILAGAVILQYLARIVGWYTWNEFLLQKERTISIDNYLFLFIVYPFLLGTIVIYVDKRIKRQ